MTAMKTTVAFVLVVLAGAASAERGPLYVGASYGMANLDGTATADDNIETGEDGLPETLPLNNLPFDDDDGSWTAFAGYQINPFAALELGYTNLGRFNSSANILGGTSPEVEAESLYVAARFRYPLSDNIFATWHLGLAETSFDVEGSVELNIGSPIFGPIAVVNVPFATPEDETGYRWGFGFDWQFAPRLGTAVAFTRHDVGVFEIDTYDLRLVFRF